MTPAQLESLVRDYYKILDDSLETITHGQEGKLVHLPSDVLTTRDIHCGVTPDGRGVVISVVRDERLTEDRLSCRELCTAEDIAAVAAPHLILFEPPNKVVTAFSATLDAVRGMNPNWSPMTPEQLAAWPYHISGDTMALSPNPLAAPLVPPSRAYLGFGKTEEAYPSLTVEAAKMKAVELWSAVLAGKLSIDSGSFIQVARDAFERFSAIIKRKAFVERRIHRFLNEHAGLLLPPFTRCFFEHKLHLGAEERKADFILEREAGRPALLIELESPTHSVFRRDGHLTAEANYAAQVADWVRCIDEDSARNASDALSFLAGPKDRLVVIGRGVTERQRMLDSRFSGTTVWTYDLLVQEARTRWNNQLATQRRMLGLEDISPF